MLSYQHSYHAGSFADVLKHLALLRTLVYLTQKDKPLFYLETHSGRGIYNLKDDKALKTGEAKDGIALLWEHRKNLPKVFSPYINAISELNENQQLRYYPGSPFLALQTLRAQDRLYCCELHPAEFNHLQEMPTLNKRIYLDESDGFQKLTDLLPPPERRGLIVIDPAYELKNEYKDLPQRLKKAYQRFETGVYLVWYPLVNPHFHQQLLRGLIDTGADKHLQVEFYLNDPQKEGMYGTGLWIINPPYLLKNELEEILKILSHIFNPGKSTYLVKEKS